MDASGLDAIVTWAPTNVRYLTGYWCWAAPLFREFMVLPGGTGDLVMRTIAVLLREGPSILVLDRMWGLNAVGSTTADIRLFGSGGLRDADEPVVVPELLQPLYQQLTGTARLDDPFEALADALAERGLASPRLGVELDGASLAERAALRRCLPRAELLDCTNLLRLIRAVKTDGEIARLERAAAIAEEAATAACAGLRSGTAAAEAAQDFRTRVACQGADYDHFAVGPYGLGLAAGGPVTLDRGDGLYVDFGCIHDGWFSDSGTTLCLGKPTVTSLEQFAAVRDCVSAGAAALRPGRRASRGEAAMRATLAERGIHESFPHGHGIGIEVRDYPLVMADNGRVIRDDCVNLSADLILEKNMVINLEASVFTPGVRSVHCEQTFVITAHGCRALIRQDREAPWAAV
jgi:Xaa-Pro aminopeptidase